jgi:serine/threonine-protein phosphatase 2A regulatory subunit B'
MDMKGILKRIIVQKPKEKKNNKKTDDLPKQESKVSASTNETKQQSDQETTQFVEFTINDIMEDNTVTLRDAPAEEKKSVFLHKLGLCRVVFDFLPPVSDQEANAIEKKRLILNDLVEYISTQDWFSEEALIHLLHMVKRNLFRGLPSNHGQEYNESLINELDEDAFQDPAWPHLHLIYEVLLRFLLSPNANKKIMKKHLRGLFLDTLIEMFESEDMRERDYLKTILHRVYGRFMPLRQPIRKSICNVCYRYIYDKKSSNGIAEFLDIFSSIIHGFALPIKQEHQEFLKNVLIPLHKTSNLELFHQHLAECVIQFIYKDYRMGPIVIEGLLKFWPVMCPPKEVLFLDELQDAIGEMMNANDFEMDNLYPLIAPIFGQISRCIESPNYTVGERALTMWNSDFIRWLCAELRDRIFPIVAPSLLRNVRYHWSENVRSLSDDVQDVFKDIDPVLWQTAENLFKQKQDGVNTKPEERKRNYANVRKLAIVAGRKLPREDQEKLKGLDMKLYLDCLTEKIEELTLDEPEELKESNVADVSKMVVEQETKPVSLEPDLAQKPEIKTHQEMEGIDLSLFPSKPGGGT